MMPQRRDDHSATSTSADLQGLRCPKCGYDLRGSPEEQCAECGGPFNTQALRATYNDDRNYRDKALRLARDCLIVSAVFLCLQYVHLAAYGVPTSNTLEGILTLFAVTVAMVAQPLLLIFAVVLLFWAIIRREHRTAKFAIATFMTSAIGMFVLVYLFAHVFSDRL